MKKSLTNLNEGRKLLVELEGLKREKELKSELGLEERTEFATTPFHLLNRHLKDYIRHSWSRCLCTVYFEKNQVYKQ